MTLFPTAVEQAQAWWRQMAEEMSAGSDMADQIARPALVQQAEHVDDCVSRFTRAELEGIRLGRYGPVKVFPALGEHVGRKLAELDPDARQAAALAVAKAVAAGYVFMASIEDEPNVGDQGRTPREVWEVWVPGLNSGLIEQTALPPDLVSMVRAAAGTAFKQEAVNLGLGGFGKRGRLRHIGAFYGQAGAMLRAIQVHEGTLEPDPANIWPYDQHPPLD